MKYDNIYTFRFMQKDRVRYSFIRDSLHVLTKQTNRKRVAQITTIETLYLYREQMSCSARLR